jgi:hypothetical protein
MTLKKTNRWISVMMLALLALNFQARAALFSISPPAWGGVLVGAGILAGGGTLVMMADKAESTGGRIGMRVLGTLLAAVGFMMLDDDKVIPELKEIDMTDAKLMKALASKNISEEDVDFYNEHRTRITALANTIVYDSDYSKLSNSEKSALIVKKARENQIPDSALKVAGVLGEAVKHAYAK